jgi:hypothetical protein
MSEVEASGSEELDPRFDEMLADAQALHDKVARVNPDLVVQMTFGDRKLAPAIVGDPETAKRADFATFRNVWANGGHFVNAFSKEGDGFVNVSFLTETRRILE